MRWLALVLGICLGSVTASGVTRDLSNCAAYVRAPDALKRATAGLVTAKAGAEERAVWRQEFVRYVGESPPGSTELATFLKDLGEDSPGGSSTSLFAFGEHLFASYLLKPGNEEIATTRISDLMEVFWLDFMFGETDEATTKGRFAAGYAFMEGLLDKILKLADENPKAVRDAWKASFDQFLPELIAPQEFLDVLSDVGDAARRDYVRGLAKELGVAPKSRKIDDLIQLYVLPADSFQRNRALASDLTKLQGTYLDAIDPIRAFVFLYRLDRRMPKSFRLDYFRAVDELLKGSP